MGGPRRMMCHMHSPLPFKFFERAEYLLTAGRRLCTLEHERQITGYRGLKACMILRWTSGI
jgi:hypothetical protein